MSVHEGGREQAVGKKKGGNALGEWRELLLNSVFVCWMLTLQNRLTDWWERKKSLPFLTTKCFGPSCSPLHPNWIMNYTGNHFQRCCKHNVVVQCSTSSWNRIFPHCQIYKLFKDGQFEGNAQELSIDKHVYFSHPCSAGSHMLTESLLEKWLPLVPWPRVAYLRAGAKANVSTRLFRLMESDFPLENTSDKSVCFCAWKTPLQQVDLV